MQPATVVLIYVIIWWVILFGLAHRPAWRGMIPRRGRRKFLTFAKKRFGQWYRRCCYGLCRYALFLSRELGDQLYIYAQTGELVRLTIA